MTDTHYTVRIRDQAYSARNLDDAIALADGLAAREFFWMGVRYSRRRRARSARTLAPAGLWRAHSAARAAEAPVCTVHAAPDCQQPDGPTYSGIGWDHAGADPRIECAACAAYLSV